jgi:hypothetical protein
MYGVWVGTGGTDWIVVAGALLCLGIGVLLPDKWPLNQKCEGLVGQVRRSEK